MFYVMFCYVYRERDISEKINTVLPVLHTFSKTSEVCNTNRATNFNKQTSKQHKLKMKLCSFFLLLFFKKSQSTLFVLTNVETTVSRF